MSYIRVGKGGRSRKKIWGSDAEWILFCDSKPTKDAILQMENALRLPGAGAVVPCNLALDHPRWHDTQTNEIVYADFDAFAVLRTVYEQTGGVDFAKGKTALTDFVWRIKESGYTVKYLQRAKVGCEEVAFSALLQKKLSPMEIIRQIQLKVHRKLLLRDAYRHRYYDNRQTAENLTEGLLRTIARHKKGTKPTVAVFAPCPGEKTLSQSEGYMRRVTAVDREILQDSFRIYLYESPYRKVHCIEVEQPSENCLALYYNSNYSYHRSCVLKVISACGVLYSHSVLRLIPVENAQNAQFWPDIFSDRDVVHVFDAHGIVPEESEYHGEAERAALENKAEALYIAKADVIVTLTQAMSRHFLEKHRAANLQDNMVQLPMFSADILPKDRLIHKPFMKGKPVVIYAGGVQRWQNIPLIQQAMRERFEEAVFRICVTNAAEFMSLWGHQPLPEDTEVGLKPLSLLASEYAAAHYGFLLRDDIALNRVACPTKLIEYIKFGIVPILLSPNIGDFLNLGLRYVPFEDFLRGKWPTPDQRDEMTQQNHTLLEIMERQYATSRSYLKQRVEAAASLPAGEGCSAVQK